MRCLSLVGVISALAAAVSAFPALSELSDVSSSFLLDPRAASDGPALLSGSVKVLSPPKNSTFRFGKHHLFEAQAISSFTLHHSHQLPTSCLYFLADGHLFNFTYNGIAGSEFHTTGVQVQITTLALGDGYRASGAPKTFNGYARTTQATIANIRPNAFQPNSTDVETENNLFNRYEYQLMAPKIPDWQRDLPGYLVIIEFYSTPNVSARREVGGHVQKSMILNEILLWTMTGSRTSLDKRAVLAPAADVLYAAVRSGPLSPSSTLY